jgi:hypothetical protein
LFALLSILDLSLTWRLLELPGSRIYESNPIAAWWLAQHGWLGLVGFKGGIALLVLGLTIAISYRRPRAAGRVLQFGCAALFLVVFYSAALCRPAQMWSEQSAAIASKRIFLEREMRMGREYRRVLDEALGELLAGRCGLAAAVARLAETEKGRDPKWLELLANMHQGRTNAENLAVNLIINGAVVPDRGPEAAWRFVRQLEREFQLIYGNSPQLDRRLLLADIQRQTESAEVPRP